MREKAAVTLHLILLSDSAGKTAGEDNTHHLDTRIYSSTAIYLYSTMRQHHKLHTCE